MKMTDQIDFYITSAPKGFVRDSDNNIILDSDGNPKKFYYTKKKWAVPVLELDNLSAKKLIEAKALQAFCNAITGYTANYLFSLYGPKLPNTKDINEQYSEFYNGIIEWIGGFSWDTVLQFMARQTIEHQISLKENQPHIEKTEEDYLTLLKKCRIILSDNECLKWDEKRERLLVNFFKSIPEPEQNIAALLLMHIFVASDIFINYDYSQPDEEKDGYSPRKFVFNPSSTMMNTLLNNNVLQKAFNESAINKIYSICEEKRNLVNYSPKPNKPFFEEVIKNTALFIVSIIIDKPSNTLDYHLYRQLFRVLCNDVFFEQFDIYFNLHKDKFNGWTLNNHNNETLFYFPYANTYYIHNLHNLLEKEIFLSYETYQNNQKSRKNKEAQHKSLKKVFEKRYQIFVEDFNLPFKRKDTKIKRTYLKTLNICELEDNIFVQLDKISLNSPENQFNLINMMLFCKFSLFTEEPLDFDIYRKSVMELKNIISDSQNSLLSQDKFNTLCLSVQPEEYYYFMSLVIENFSTLTNNDVSISDLYSVYWSLEGKQYRFLHPSTNTVKMKLESIVSVEEV